MDKPLQIHQRRNLYKNKKQYTKSILYDEPEEMYSDSRGNRVIKPKIRSNNSSYDGELDKSLFGKKSLYCPICQSSNLHNSQKSSSMTIDTVQLKQARGKNNLSNSKEIKLQRKSVKRPPVWI